MLADIRSRDQNFRQRNGVIREEVELEVCLGVRIGIEDTGNVDNEANGQLGNVISRSSLAGEEDNATVDLLPFRA